jgi:PKD repeat protein
VGVTGTWTVNVNLVNNSYTTLSVRWGDESLYGAALASPQVTYLSGQQTFTFTHSYLQSGTYTVTFTVSNAGGQSNTATASVIVSGSGQGQITLTSLSPSTGHIGMQVILQGSGFTTYDNTVHFGVGGTQHLVSQNGTQIYYTIPAYISPCDLIGYGCGAPAQLVTPGTYQVYVTNTLGQTSQQTFTVTP